MSSLDADSVHPRSPTAHRRDSTLRLEQFLPYRLNVAASVVSQALSRLYADRYDIGVAEWRVIATLGQFGTMSSKAIGEHSYMHKTKVSRAVAVLEQRKLVSRRINDEDMRQALLSLTPGGRAIYDDVAPVAHDFAERLTNLVNPADRAAFERTLQQLIQFAASCAADLVKGRRRS